MSDADRIPPRTTRKPAAEGTWELSLSEAISIAIQNSDVIRVLVGPTVAADPATIYDPSISETQVQVAMAAFDANWSTSLFWSRTDQPPGVTFGGGIPVPNQRDQASFNSSLTKLFCTGATGGIAFNTSYLLIPPFPTVTTSPGPDGIFGTPDDVFTPGIRRTPAQYIPNLEFTLTQPLLKGAGVEFNQALIRIACIQRDQSLWEFKQAVLAQVRSVEEAYWDLLTARGALQALDAVLPELEDYTRVWQVKLEEGAGHLGQFSEAQTRVNEFRQQHAQALAAVLNREAALRNLMGLSPTDRRQLVPTSTPSEVPVDIEWTASVETALSSRPDIVRQRLAVRIRELELLRANNAYQPQFDLQGLWRINGLDNELDDAIKLVSDNQFTDWQIGLTFSMPLGFRQAAAEVDAAELRLDRDHAQLSQSIHATVHQLAEILRDIDSSAQELKFSEQRLKNSRIWAEKAGERARRDQAGDEISFAQNLYIQALESLRNAIFDNGRVLSRYNIALARLEEAKGTLLQSRGIVMAEDPTTRVRFRKPCRQSVEMPSGEPDNKTQHSAIE